MILTDEEVARRKRAAMGAYDGFSTPGAGSAGAKGGSGGGIGGMGGGGGGTGEALSIEEQIRAIHQKAKQ